MFEITNSRDFFAMLVDDFDDYRDDASSARRALHCAITEYHLREWIWEDWLSKDGRVLNALGKV